MRINITNEQAMSQDNFVKRKGSKFVFNCLYCGKEFLSKGYEVRAGRTNKYCSNKCQTISPKRRKNALKALLKTDKKGDNNSNWKGGYYFYGHARKKFCELCRKTVDEIKGKQGRIYQLSVHHKDKNHYNFHPDNLVTLCHSCHFKVHRPSNYGKYPDFQKW